MSQLRYALVVHPGEVFEAREAAPPEVPVLAGTADTMPRGTRLLVREDVLPDEVRSRVFPPRGDVYLSVDGTNWQHLGLVTAVGRIVGDGCG